MARIPYLDKKDLAPQNQELLTRNINLNRAFAHSPDALRSFTGLAQYIRHHSRLDPRLREMAILQVGYLTRSPYEYSHHIKIGREFGVRDEDIHAIVAETNGETTKLTPLDVRRIARRARLRAPRRSTARHFVLLRGRAPVGRVADRCGRRLHAVPEGIPVTGAMKMLGRTAGMGT